MSEKDKTSPATTSNAYDAMAPRWAVIDALLGGTEAMRAAGEAYLPRHEEETEKGYQARLASAVLLNMVEQTLNSLAGKPFCDPIKLNEDVPKRIEDEILPDVDLQGNKLDVFARSWFRESLSKAFAHVLIDMPKPVASPDGRPRTLADDRKEKVRPYWVLIKPECLLFCRSEVRDGAEVLLHVRIAETYTEQDGFTEVEKQRIRVLEPGMVQLWGPTKEKRNGKAVWKMMEEWNTGLPYIPLVTFYADRQDTCYGKPPLLDLAWLNVTHWQSTAEQRHILTVSRFPILACSGTTPEDMDKPIVVGPNKVLYNPDPAGRFYYVEHTGAAITAGRTDLQDLEQQMANYGAEFLKEKPGGQTATARALDSAEATTALGAMVMVFEDALAQALDITAEWMKLSQTGGTVELSKEYDIEEADAAGMDTLTKARAARDISRKTYLNALRLRDVLPEDFDEDEDLAELQEEASQTLGASSLDLNPGDPGNPPPGEGDQNPPPPKPGEQPPPPPPPAKGAGK